MDSTFTETSHKQNDIFADKTDLINECLNQFNEFTFTINEVCNHATNFGRTLQALENITVPEVIGGDQVNKAPSKRIKNSAHLTDSLDTFAKYLKEFLKEFQ